VTAVCVFCGGARTKEMSGLQIHQNIKYKQVVSSIEQSKIDSLLSHRLV